MSCMEVGIPGLFSGGERSKSARQVWGFRVGARAWVCSMLTLKTVSRLGLAAVRCGFLCCCGCCMFIASCCMFSVTHFCVLGDFCFHWGKSAFDTFVSSLTFSREQMFSQWITWTILYHRPQLAVCPFLVRIARACTTRGMCTVVP